MGRLVLLLSTLLYTVLYVDFMREFEVCSKSLWRWSEVENGGTLSIRFRTKNKVNAHCKYVFVLE